MSTIQQSITSILKERNTRKHLALVVSMIAVATALAVIWSLHINGITLASGDLICGKEEHTHTSDCYAWVPVEDGTEESTEPEETEEGIEPEETEEGLESEETESFSGTEEIETVSEAEETQAASEAEETQTASETKTEDASESETQTESILSGTGTESVENGMKSVAENSTESVTEDGTEALTEEETESAQVGDTKTVNGVEYVYTLICGKEEHTHTEECYASDDTEETEAEETTAESTNSSLEGTALTSGVTNKLRSGLVGSSGGGTSTSANYYLATTVDYTNEGLVSGEDYLIYTKIGSTYYVVNADGSLEECISVNSIDEAGTSGMYFIEDTSSVAYVASASEYSDYRWTVTSTTVDGEYYIYNSNNGTYMAPSDETAVTTAFTSRTEEITLTGDFVLEYKFKNTSLGTNTWDNYIVEMYDDSGVYVDVRADNYGWLAYQTDSNDGITFGNKITDEAAWQSAMEAGAQVTVTIVRTGNQIVVTKEAAGFTLTATATVSEYDEDAELTIYLTGENCVISDFSYEYTTYEYGTYVANGTMAETGSGSGSTASNSVFTTDYNRTILTDDGTYTSGVTVSDGYMYLSEDGTESEAAWISSGGLVFYFALAEDPVYYFSEEVTLVDAYANQDDSYIVYTRIENTNTAGGYDYYIVSSDNTLVPCTYLGSNISTTSDSFLNATATAGIYCWLDSGGEVNFKYTSANESTDGFDYYRWMLTSTSSDIDKDDGSGSYTVYNSAKSVYLAPEELGVSETVVGGDNNKDFYSGQGYNLAGATAENGVVIYTITCTALTSGLTGQFWIDAYDSDNKYFSTTSIDTPYWGDIVDNATSKSYTGDALTIEVGKTYTVMVTRSLTDNTGGNYTYTYTIAYYDSSGTLAITYTATIVENSTKAAYTRFDAFNGTYDISVTYATLKADSSENSNECKSMSTTSIDATACSDVEAALSTAGAYTDEVTLSGDFDVTWSITMSGTDGTAYNRRNNSDFYALVLNNGRSGSSDLETIYIYADDSAAASGYNTDNASVSTVIDYWDTYNLYALGSDGLPTNSGWNAWRNAMTATSGTSIEINISRVGNVITVTRTVYRGANKRSTFTTIIRDSAFIGNDVTMCLTAIKSAYTINSLKDTSNGQTYDVVSYDTYEAMTSTIQSIDLNTLSTGAYDFTATVSTVDVDNLVLYLNGTESVNWATEETKLTLYLAKVKEYTAWFDGTNGGMSSENSTDTAVVSTTDAYGNTFTVMALTETDATAPTYVSSVSSTLRGWYDIYTNTYYEPGEEFTLSGNTVLYADWEISSYDFGTDDESDHVVNTVSTSSFININMFDFNDDYDKIALN